MLEEVLTALAPQPGEVYLDGTFGGGGYAKAILDAAECKLIAVDRDPVAIARAEALAETHPRLLPQPGCFGDLDKLANKAGFSALDGVVLDLGVSSFQLDEADRGFSFMREGPLDMRMGDTGPNAADVVNQLNENELADIIFRLGEDSAARRIARAIVKRRATEPFSTTLDLASLVEATLGGQRGSRTHPATKTFQALRMFLNDELAELSRALIAAERILSAGGRLVIVTFHSLEDRIVKTFLRARAGLVGGGSRHVPERAGDQAPSFALISKKAISVSDAETERNPRARSSRLRAAKRTAAPAWSDASWPGIALPSIASVEATK